jgi:hypothetical protein
MAHVHEPVFHLRPQGSQPGLPLKGITYGQAVDKAKELAKALNKRVYVESVTTLASADPYDISTRT